jgi:hypothetical protein
VDGDRWPGVDLEDATSSVERLDVDEAFVGLGPRLLVLASIRE